MTTRVRFAPSPTGFLHLGGLRTALFNYLFAAKNDGKLILRIEDTDQTRYVPGSVEYLQESFKWLGLQFDEGPEMGGAYWPYRQSERVPLYRTYAQELVNRGGAYHCFCSKERLSAIKMDGESGKGGYDGLCRGLTTKQVQDKLQMGLSNVIRLKVPSTGSTEVNDVVYGRVVFTNRSINDQILLKADGYPTYHLANVVDDHLMDISHVLRGEEWLSSTSKHKIMYEAFNWTPPIFCHIPLLTTLSGSKLSKRNHAAHLESYKDKGYSPEGLINFVALLGWNPKNDKEIFTLQELVECFSLEGINKGSCAVDDTRLDWINTAHVRRLFKDDQVIVSRYVSDLRAELLSQKLFGLASPDHPLLSTEYLIQVLKLIQERTCLIPKIPNQASYFWVEPDPRLEKLKSFPNSDDKLKKLVEVIDANEFTKAALNNGLEQFKPINVKPLMRECVTGGMGGPDLVEAMLVIGKDRILKRIRKAIKTIQEN